MAFTPPNDFLDLKALREAPADEIVRVVSINVGDIQATMAKQPALFGYVSALSEGAGIEAQKCKREVERAKADVDVAISAYFKANTGNPVGRLEKEVDDVDTVKAARAVLYAAQDRLDAANAKHSYLVALTKSLEQRRDMLVQISAGQNREQNNT